VVPVELLLARTQDNAVVLTAILAYPTGVGFTLSVRVRRGIPRRRRRFHDQFGEAGLRFGVEFADGRKATNLDRYPPNFEAEEPDPPALTRTHSVGGDGRWSSHHWLWGLPPAGPLVFVCAWPARQIEESRVQIDAGLVLEAAERAVPIWPED
jgi:hypothetical protein